MTNKLDDDSTEDAMNEGRGLFGETKRKGAKMNNETNMDHERGSSRCLGVVVLAAALLAGCASLKPIQNEIIERVQVALTEVP